MHADQLHIAEPCTADWEQMSGDERRRFCGQCQRHVHDLNQLTETEALDLLENQDEVCVQYRAQVDGTVRFRPAQTGRKLALVAAAAALFTSPALAAGRADAGLIETLKTWWQGGDTVIAEVEASRPAGTTVQTTGIPELTQPVVVEPVETVEEEEEVRPMVKGRIAFHRERPTPEPVVEAQLD